MEEQEVTKRYESLYAGVIYDALVFDIGYKDPFVLDYEIKDRTYTGKYFGRAFTCLGQKVKKLEDIDDTVRIEMFKYFPNNCVQVIDTSGDRSVAHFGDISGKLAKKFGAKCAVIDGFTRDVDILKDDNYSVFCRNSTPIDAFERWQIVDFNCNVSMPSVSGCPVKVTPEDFLFCGSDGVIVVKGELVNEVLRLAEIRSEKEALVREEIKYTSDIQGLYDRIGRW